MNSKINYFIVVKCKLVKIKSQKIQNFEVLLDDLLAFSLLLEYALLSIPSVHVSSVTRELLRFFCRTYAHR